jgi:hypothetical protein
MAHVGALGRRDREVGVRDHVFLDGLGGAVVVAAPRAQDEPPEGQRRKRSEPENGPENGHDGSLPVVETDGTDRGGDRGPDLASGTLPY